MRQGESGRKIRRYGVEGFINMHKQNRQTDRWNGKKRHTDIKID